MPIYCANNNTVYMSIGAAARDLHIDRTAISKQLSGERHTAANHVFAKLDDLRPEKVKVARAWLLYTAFKIILDCSDEPKIYDEGCESNGSKEKRAALGSRSELAGAAGQGKPRSRQHDRAVQGRDEP